MFNMKTVKIVATALLFATLTLAHARPTAASPQPLASQQAVAPVQIVFLYINGVPVNCSSCFNHAEGHVFDIASGDVIGYVNASAPGIIVNANGTVIGFLASA
jgi:FlaG/FlaF family flagellin (archaellin)